MCNFPLVLEDFIASYLLVTVIVTSCLFQSYLSLNHSQHCLFKSLSKVPVIFRKGNRTAKHIHCEHSKTKYFTIVSFKKLNNKKKTYYTQYKMTNFLHCYLSLCFTTLSAMFLHINLYY